jgi:hypothetical protein
VSDIAELLATFDERVPLLVDKRVDFATHGRCSICNAQVVRESDPIFRDSSLQRAKITPGPLPDLGAEVLGPVPVCGYVFAAAPADLTKSEKARIENAYPRLSPKDWLAYMAALSTEA